MYIKNIFKAVLLAAFFVGLELHALEVIRLEPVEGDMTPLVRERLEAVSNSQVKLIFAPGTYRFRPDYAAQEYCAITNHDNGLKSIIFPFEGFESVEIEGNGAELIFHGRVLPFRFEKCERITARGFSIDWDVPFNFLGEVVAVNPEEGWRDVRPFTEGFSWKLANEEVLFPEVDGFSFSSLGSTLAFTPDTKRVVHGGWDISSKPRWVEKRPGGILRFHERLRHWPPVGSLLNSKGPKGENRYGPGIDVVSSANVLFEDVVIHHALGMGFLFERSADITLRRCGVYLWEDSPRVVSSTADATHFCNCRGDILVEDCRFENMLDDGTNVHGTYVEVDRVLDEKTVRVRLKHFQQLGFEFAGPGDELWFIHAPDPSRAETGRVAAARMLNEQFIELRFENALPASLKPGDVLENKTWNPTFTMRRCTIRDHRARNIVLKTPRRILIEDNDFSSMMSSVFFRGETFSWWESGAVDDVLIRNNRFEYCAYSGAEHAVLYITPRLGAAFDQTTFFDRNIRFVDNTIETFDNRIVWADRVDGLVIEGNTIRQTHDAEPLHPDAPLFEFSSCRDIRISGNTYEGDCQKPVVADKTSQSTLRVERNRGF